MSEQIKYTKVSEEAVAATGYLNEIGTNLSIPAKIRHAGKSYFVTEIGESAFSGCSNLQAVTFERIAHVRAKAFAGCENLMAAQLGNSLKTIGGYAFAWCGLQAIILPPPLDYIGEYAFVGCSKLRQIVCSALTPPKITSKSFDQDSYEKGYVYVAPEALEDYRNDENWKLFKHILTTDDLKANTYSDTNTEEDEENENEEKDLIFTEKIIFRILEAQDQQVSIEQCHPDIKGNLHLPDTITHEGKIYEVTSIEKGALENCDKLQQIFLSSNLNEIPFGTFAHCSSLQNIYVDPSNQNFCDLNGVLFDKYRSILFCYPKGRKDRHYQVPSGTVGLAPACFIDCEALESVYLFDNIRYIGIQAFYKCSSLKTISLPAALGELYGGAFYMCDHLESVYALGEMPAAINDSFDTDTLKRATLYVGRENLQLYKASNEWNKFNKIKMLNDISLNDESLLFRQNGERTITLTAANNKLPGRISVPEMIEYKGVSYTVDRIGRNSFEDCHQLTEIELPNSINSIGYRAMSGCMNLKSVNIPINLRIIENEAFSFCVNLTSIFLPEHVEAIGDCVFNGDIKLQEIKVDRNNKQYVSQDGILYDRRGALVAYPAAKKESTFVLPASVDAMNGSTFVDAANLTQFEVPSSSKHYSTVDGVLVSKDQSILIAYPRGRKDKKYSVYGSIRQINQWAFTKCKASHITLPENLQELEPGAFFNCPNLVQITLPQGLTAISERCFLSCEKLKKVSLPESIESIGIAAFLNCKELEEINLPDKITRIEKGTFASCASLTHIELPEELESIGDQAFANCPQLSNITIPASVNSIGEEAFSNTFVELGMLTSLLNNGENMSIIMKGETPPVIAKNTFDPYCYSKVDLIVPENTVENYRHTTGWMQFKSIISRPSDKKEKRAAIGFSNSNFIYTIIGENKVELTKWENRNEKELTISSQVTHKDVTYTITKIGESAFEDSAIEKIRIEAPIEVIEKYAFANCYNLESIRLPKTLREIGIGVFGGCTSLKQVNLPSNLKELGIEAFAECHYLKAIALPNSIDKINYHTFYNCFHLSAITVPDRVESIEEGAFGKCKELEHICFGNGLKEIGKRAFEYCEWLTEIELPDSVEMIEDEAFRFCTGLKEIDLPSELRFMGNCVFKKCSNLDRLYLSNECEHFTVEDNVLYSSDKSELIFHPAALVRTGVFAVGNTVKAIHDYAFEGCHIEEITISDKTTTIGDYCFSNSKIKRIQLPAKLKNLGGSVFLGCKGLTSVTLPDKIVHLKEGLFRSCSKLTEVHLPNQLKMIETSVFKGCTALKEIVINGENCTIAEKAFEDCKALETVELNGIKLAENSAFHHCDNIKNLRISKESDVDVKRAFK